MTRIRDEATGAGYERWAIDVDYAFTRPQAAVSRYEIVRAAPLSFASNAEWEYVELIEVADAETFPRVFEQPEAEPVIAELRTFIEPDPLGLVGSQIAVSPADAERSPHRALAAITLTTEKARDNYEVQAAKLVEELLSDPAVVRAELVRVEGRYKNPEPPPCAFLVILDLAAEASATPPEAALERLRTGALDPSSSFALGGALIEHLDQHGI